MPRASWKGAISFGLVNIPVALYSAASESGIDFDWLDKRSMDPVGYKRINKRTGKAIDKDDIVKGVAVDGDNYVVLGEDEIKAAYPKTTQTIEIEAFVRAEDIAFTHLERPYYLEPQARADKVYSLLREAMLASKVVGVARFVMHSKEHLAALIPSGPALILNTLRWASEIRPWTGIDLPAAGRKHLQDGELKMARQLIGQLTQPWNPEAYADRFTDAINALVAKRVATGATAQVEVMEDAGHGSDSRNVIDLTELLKRSLKPASAKRGAPAAPKTARKAARKTAARKRA